MADLKKQLKDFKTVENKINGNEYVFVSQNGNTRKTTINDIKKFAIGTGDIGTEDMGTSATTIKGAIKEHEEEINNIATQLNEKANEINTIITEYAKKTDVNDLASKKAEKNDLQTVSNELNVQKARIDTFTKLAEGSTTGDAELQDIRVGADGTIYNNAGGAIRNQFKEIRQNKKGYLTTKGEFKELDSWTTTTLFIPIENIKTLNIPLWRNEAAICCYDDSFTFLTSVVASKATSSPTEYFDDLSELPVGTKYIKYCYSNSFKADIVFEDALGGFMKGVEQHFNQIGENFELISKSIIGSFVAGKYYTLNGELGTSDPWFIFDSKLPVDSITKIKIPLWYNVGCIICYDGFGEFISAIQSTQNTSSPTEYFDDLSKLPVGTKYIKYCYRKSFPCIIEFKDFLRKNIDNLLEISRKNKSSQLPLYGKNILSIGDSYTYLNYYGKALEEVTGATQTARGWNGSEIYGFIADQYTPTDKGGATVSQPFNAELLEPYDIVTIMGGTNDYGNSRKPLGDINSPSNANTVYGSLKCVIDKILTLKPTIKIVLCTQPYRLDFAGHDAPGGYAANSQGYTMEDVANAVIEVGHHFGLPVFDFYRNSGWNSYTVRKVDGVLVDNPYTYDGLHPKQGVGNGAEMLGKALGNFINNNITF